MSSWSSWNETVHDGNTSGKVTLVIGSVVQALIIAITIIGNVFVIAAYLRDPRIRANVANLLFVNLAVTDLVIGTVSLPLNLSLFINGSWLYGEVVCKIWCVLDYSVCWLSMIGMVIISWDRYCLVKMGLKYKSYQTTKRLGLILLISWSVVFGFMIVITVAWGPITGQDYVNYDVSCSIEFVYTAFAPFVINVGPFSILLLSVVILNVMVYANIYRRSQGKREAPSASNPEVLSTDASSEGITVSDVAISGVQGARAAETDSSQGSTTFQGNESYGQVYGVGLKDKSVNSYTVSTISAQMASGSANTTARREAKPAAEANPKQSGLVRAKSSARKHDGASLAKHRRAAVVLGVLTGCFILFWSPYIITTVVYSICGDTCIPYVTWSVVEGLAWFNSAINPFIYASTNPNFRKNFSQFLLIDRFSGLCGKK